MSNSNPSITITLTTDHAAFEDNSSIEVARILRDLAERIERNGMESGDEFVLRDYNGNKVGTAVAE